MITISVCMIVKNEEKNLDRCLGSLTGIADEIIVVDTGSTDGTKDVAYKYTDKVCDYTWNGNFADARNYAFSMATCDYIYSADADEELDDLNQDRFRQLKRAMLPEIDVVQMYYCNQLENNTIYSFDRELRPKLYKRLREPVWDGNIHEAVRLTPVIYDSEIEIIHRPGPGHAGRDLAAFRNMIDAQGRLDERLCEIYAKELYIAGEEDDLRAAAGYFVRECEEEGLSAEALTRDFAIAARCLRIMEDIPGFMKYVLRAAAGELMSSEMCVEIAAYYEGLGDIDEARMWYYNAAYETEAYLDIKAGDDIPKEALERLQ